MNYVRNHFFKAPKSIIVKLIDCKLGTSKLKSGDKKTYRRF